MSKKNIISFALLFVAIVLNAQKMSLDDCIALAKKQNAAVQTAQLDQQIAQSKIREVKAGTLPQVSINGDYRYLLQIPSQVVPATLAGGKPGEYAKLQFGVPWNLGTSVQATQILYSPQLKNGLEAIKAVSEVSNLNIQKAEKDVAFQVSNLYYNVQILEKQIQFLKENASAIAKTKTTMQLLKDNLLAKGTDVDRLSLSEQTLLTQAENLEISKQQLLNTLKFQLGKSLNEDLTLEVLEVKQNPMLEEGKNRRIELQLLDAQRNINGIEQRSIKDDFKPSVVAYGQYNNTGTGQGGDNAFMYWIPTSAIGVQVRWNVFDGFARKRKLETKMIEASKIGVQNKVLNESIALESQNAKANFQSQQRLAANQQQQIDLAKKIYTQTELQLKNGIIGITDLIQADNSVREAQNNFINTLIKLKISELEYKKAIGDL
jgi:outer membrane protein TolC